MIVGEAEYSKIDKTDRLKMIEDFDRLVKRDFSGADRPVSVALRGVKDDPDAGIVNGRIVIQG